MKLGAYKLSEELNVTPMTIYNWVDKGCPFTLEQYGMKKVKRFEVKEVQKWLKQQ